VIKAKAAIRAFTNLHHSARHCREQIGAGVVDLSFETPGSEDPEELMEALELFGKKVLPHIRDI
jgi:hypothetical protein